MTRILLIIFTYLSLSVHVFAETIKKIEVKGNQRFSNETVILFSGLSINQDYDSNDLNDALKELNKTDFFKKINFSFINDTLSIEVVENPIIEDLEIRGIKSKTFTKKLYELMDLKSRKSYKDSTFQSDLNLIRNIIKKNGYYFSEIKTFLTTNEELNSVRLVYDIILGEKAKIGEIVFFRW